jgi:hypothetical protein
MNIPLGYQRTEYDCGPTAFLNALSFLLKRKNFPPDILKYVMMYTLDSYSDKGEPCKNGTSQMAMMFLSNWLNQYGKASGFPITCEFLNGEQVQIGENSPIIAALQQGGVVVVRIWYGCGHYVTLTGLDGDYVTLFDPYYRRQPFHYNGVSHIKNRPCAANRKVKIDVFNQPGKHPYILEDTEKREAVILFNTDTRKTAENTIEYFL